MLAKSQGGIQKVLGERQEKLGPLALTSQAMWGRKPKPKHTHTHTLIGRDDKVNMVAIACSSIWPALDRKNCAKAILKLF